MRRLHDKEPGLRDLRALEPFAGHGNWLTKYYASYCSSLDLWEIREECRPSLERNFPNAKIKITNSFEEIKTTPKKFDLVVLDNPSQNYGEKSEHSEHFDLFPDVFRVCADSAILIMNVIPYANDGLMRAFPKLFDQDHMGRRASFYRTEHPEKLSFEQMVSAYRSYAEASGFAIDWYLTQNRHHSLFLLALKIRKA